MASEEPSAHGGSTSAGERADLERRLTEMEECMQQLKDLETRRTEIADVENGDLHELHVLRLNAIDAQVATLEATNASLVAQLAAQEAKFVQMLQQMQQQINTLSKADTASSAVKEGSFSKTPTVVRAITPTAAVIAPVVVLPANVPVVAEVSPAVLKLISATGSEDGSVQDPEECKVDKVNETPEERALRKEKKKSMKKEKEEKEKKGTEKKEKKDKDDWAGEADMTEEERTAELRQQEKKAAKLASSAAAAPPAVPSKASDTVTTADAVAKVSSSREFPAPPPVVSRQSTLPLPSTTSSFSQSFKTLPGLPTRMTSSFKAPPPVPSPANIAKAAPAPLSSPTIKQPTETADDIFALLLANKSMTVPMDVARLQKWGPDKVKTYNMDAYAQERCSPVKKRFKVVPWSQVLSWTDEIIPAPLLDKVNAKSLDAIQVFRNITGFMGDRKTSKDEMGHIRKLLNNAFACKDAEQTDEVYCQLIKQLTNNPSRASIVSGYKLMMVCLSCFPPSDHIFPYLAVFLQDRANETSPASTTSTSGVGGGGDKECYKLISLCRYLCTLAYEYGPRSTLLSQKELDVYLALEMNVAQVELLDGTTFSLKFYAQTAAADVTTLFRSLLGLRASTNFALHVRYVDGGTCEIIQPDEPVRDQTRMIDVVNSMEASKLSMENKAEIEGRPMKVKIQLTFQVKHHSASELVKHTGMTQHMFFLQASDSIVNESLSMASENCPITESQFIELMTLQLVAESRKSTRIDKKYLVANLSRFMPRRLSLNPSSDFIQLIGLAANEMPALSCEEAKRQYLKMVATFQLYGCKTFGVVWDNYVSNDGTESKIHCTLGVSEQYVTVNSASKTVLPPVLLAKISRAEKSGADKIYLEISQDSGAKDLRLTFADPNLRLSCFELVQEYMHSNR